MKYKFIRSEPSLLVELFLPRKEGYQGALYTTLKEGFTLHKKGYASHFKNPDNEKLIREMLDDYGVEGNYERFVERNRKLLTGYSMYEVHGVFCSDDEDNPQVYDEQTTVIKIIFKPDYKDLRKKMDVGIKGYVTEKFLINLARIFFRSSYRNNEINTLKYYAPLTSDSCYQELSETERDHCIKVLRHWVDDVGMFLFGYIVYQLTIGVHDLEEEFWITSHWNFNVNRVVRLKNEDKEIIE